MNENEVTIDKQHLDDAENAGYFGGNNGETQGEIKEFRKLWEAAFEFELPCTFDHPSDSDAASDRALVIAQNQWNEMHP